MESSARLNVQLLTGSGLVLEQCRPDLPLLGHTVRERAVGEERRRRRPDEGVNRVPDAVHVGNLVGDELDREKRDGETQDHRMGQHLERLG